MQKFKSECEALVKWNAVILVRDGSEKNDTPIYVTRKVVGCYEDKCGRGSEWGVCINKPLCDGAEKVLFKSIKGWNIDGGISVLGLICDMECFVSRTLTSDQVDMIIPDAKARLRIATEDSGRYNAKAKIEEKFIHYLRKFILKVVDEEKQNQNSILADQVVSEFFRKIRNSESF